MQVHTAVAMKSTRINRWIFEATEPSARRKIAGISKMPARLKKATEIFSTERNARLKNAKWKYKINGERADKAL